MFSVMEISSAGPMDRAVGLRARLRVDCRRRRLGSSLRRVATRLLMLIAAVWMVAFGAGVVLH